MRTGPDEEPVTIDFTPPFRRISMVSGLSEAFEHQVPRGRLWLLKSAKTSEENFERFEHYGLAIAAHHARMLDKLVGDYLEEQLVNPGFICDHPQPRRRWRNTTDLSPE